MIFIPLPFVVALMFTMLLVWTWRNQESDKVNRPFIALLALCTVQSIVIGLRWGYHISELRYLLPVLASCLPPLIYESFCRLVDAGDNSNQRRWFMLAPPLIICLMLVAAPYWIDLALIIIFIGYAVALVILGTSGPDGLGEARFENTSSAHRAIYIAAASLCLSAMTDFAVWFDFERAGGANVGWLVGNGNLLALIIIGLTARVASTAQTDDATQNYEIEDRAFAEQDQDILKRVDQLLSQTKLYCDDNLTLSRLARRLVIPARQISGAVNRLSGKNVSQFINDYRIAETCRLLRETDISVTAAMFESGFQTKSNFNREFKRVTATSPAEWRAKNKAMSC